MSDADFATSQASVLTRLLRLSQIASNPALVDSSYQGTPAKFAELDTLLDQLVTANGRKVIVWSYYVGTIRALLQRYRRYRPVAIYGGTDVAERAGAVRSFQQDSGTMLLIANPQAAGTGLTLTAAAYAIYETLSWRYDLYAQSLDRIHRIGQSRNVTYFHLLATDTIDLQVLDRLATKRNFAASVLGDPKSMPRLTRLEVLKIVSV